MSKMHLNQLTVVFGMTETSPASFQSSTDTPLSARLDTVGKVLPHVEAKIIDIDGAVVPRGVSGELLLRGYLVMQVTGMIQYKLRSPSTRLDGCIQVI
jgi:fatty-acyl-CoA synthase